MQQISVLHVQLLLMPNVFNLQLVQAQEIMFVLFVIMDITLLQLLQYAQHVQLHQQVAQQELPDVHLLL